MIYGALSELEVLDLIERKKVHNGMANYIYVKCPDKKENVRLNAKRFMKLLKKILVEYQRTLKTTH